MMPATKNTEAIARTEYLVLGRFSRFQVRRRKPSLAWGGAGTSAEGVDITDAHCVDVEVGRLDARADVGLHGRDAEQVELRIGRAQAAMQVADLDGRLLVHLVARTQPQVGRR